MTLARLNLLTALLAFAAAILWTMLGNGFSGLIWLGVCAVSLALGAFALGNRDREASPGRRLAYRFTRLMRWM